ncbi:MAG: carboxypeptidase M32 [Spirochaetia bacterium]
MSNALQQLKELDREVVHLNHIGALLGWDQETYMPPLAIDERSDQLSLLEGLAHERKSADKVGKLLEELGSTTENPKGDESLDFWDRAFLRAVRRRYDQATKIPQSLVVEMAKEVSQSQAAWVEAKKANDFPSFAPHLEKLLSLSKQVAEDLGYEDHPYDALLDQYEPQMTKAKVSQVFSELQKELVPLVEKISSCKQVNDEYIFREFSTRKQNDFGKFIQEQMGYNFQRGRLDLSAHPFTTTLGGNDVRLTTRYNKHYFNTGIFGNIHEAGHGLYELGFAERIKGSVLADGTSLGIHESQSRMWENMIGRSRDFWLRYYPDLLKHFPDSLSDASGEDFYLAVNKVAPSLIRIEADEVTYSLHVILRFNLEVQLISGDLTVQDLPEAWNNEMEKLLGVRPKNDSEGVLQDIHWSMGAFGYFPTYALGNLYGAQFFDTMKKQIPNVSELIRSGELQTILGWLRENIHQYGASKTPVELISDITGKPLDASFFMNYLKDKFSKIYGF